MRYRDHMNLGTLIYMPFLSGTFTGLLPQQLAAHIFPFACVTGAGSWIPQALAYFCYSIGCCIPDIDIAFYPDGGHRMKSPMHNLSFMLLIYGLVLTGGFMPEIQHTKLMYPCAAALVFGCLAHLSGDMLQGGVAWGLSGHRKRLGFRSFRWEAYSGTFKGSFLSAGIAITAFVCWTLLLGNTRPGEGNFSYGVLVAGTIWFYSIALCRSCVRYLNTALVAAIFLSIGFAMRPGLFGI